VVTKRPVDHQLQESLSCYLSTLVPVISKYITAKEEVQIYKQLQKTWLHNRQVLWHGISMDLAQKWADEHHMQTLTTVMGPLRDSGNPECPKNRKSPGAWCNYNKVASAIFAWYITAGETVTVLTPPPPVCFNPFGGTSYQTIEEPILKGAIRGRKVGRIEMVHPESREAWDFHYQLWPVNQIIVWTGTFGHVAVEPIHWRTCKNNNSRLTITVTRTESNILKSKKASDGDVVNTASKNVVTKMKNNNNNKKKKKKKKKKQVSFMLLKGPDYLTERIFFKSKKSQTMEGTPTIQSSSKPPESVAKTKKAKAQARASEELASKASGNKRKKSSEAPVERSTKKVKNGGARPSQSHSKKSEDIQATSSADVQVTDGQRKVKSCKKVKAPARETSKQKQVNVLQPKKTKKTNKKANPQTPHRPKDQKDDLLSLTEQDGVRKGKTPLYILQTAQEGLRSDDKQHKAKNSSDNISASISEAMIESQPTHYGTMIFEPQNLGSQRKNDYSSQGWWYKVSKGWARLICWQLKKQ
jgi:hypothetical protein